MWKVNTIVHPTDFSDYSAYAFRLANALAMQQGARLVVVHVLPLPAAVGFEGVAIMPPAPADFKEVIEERLRTTCPADRNVPANYFVEEGIPADTILSVAKKWNADMIVMGTHGRTGLGRLLMGSTAEQVMRRATCPVLTVKSPEKTGAAESTSATASA